MLCLVHSFVFLASLVAVAAMTTQRVNRAVDSVLREVVEIAPNGGIVHHEARLTSHVRDAAFDNAEVERTTRAVARTDVAAAEQANSSSEARDNCKCLNHFEAERCHDHFGPKFRDAFLAGTLCIADPGPKPWCYTGLECMGAPGLGMSSQKTCKYRDADEDACEVASDMCECFPVDGSKECHPDFAPQFHMAMVMNNSACVDDGSGPFCYTSLSCQKAADSSQGKCKYMYVSEDHKVRQCSIPSDEVETFPSDAPTQAPTWRRADGVPTPARTSFPTPAPTPETPRPTFAAWSDPASEQERQMEEARVERAARVNRQTTSDATLVKVKQWRSSHPGWHMAHPPKKKALGKNDAPKAKSLSLALVGVILVMLPPGH